MAPPPTLHARVEIAKAIRTIAAQQTDEHARRRAEINVIRRDLNDIPELLRKALGEYGMLLQAELRKYGPDERRVPGADATDESKAQALAKASPDDPEHPGWPAGTPGGLGGKFRPKEGGDESADDGEGDPNKAFDETTNEWVRLQKYGRGHHWVPRVVFRKRNFSAETKTIFENWTSGRPLADASVNSNTVEHMEYNEAVDKLLDAFLAKNNITEEQMTPAQAREFVEEVLGSAEPRIRGLKLKVMREVERYIRVFGPRLGGGDEE